MPPVGAVHPVLARVHQAGSGTGTTGVATLEIAVAAGSMGVCGEQLQLLFLCRKIGTQVRVTAVLVFGPAFLALANIKFAV